MRKILVYDPQGTAEQQGRMALAPNRRDWRSAKVGILDNTKQHAAELMEQIAVQFGKRVGGVTVVRARKASAAVGATAEQLALMQECDLVLTGTGD